MFSRLAGLNIREGGPQTSAASSSPPRISVAQDPRHQDRVAILLKNPELFAAFKRRVSETNNFSNASACFILHDFLDEIDLPTWEDKSTATAPKSPTVGNSTLSGLFSTLRDTITYAPPTPTHNYRSHFECPESPQPNLSPTQTPLTPISATSSACSAWSTPSSNQSYEDYRMDIAMSKAKSTSHSRTPSHPVCLEQPDF